MCWPLHLQKLARPAERLVFFYQQQGAVTHPVAPVVLCLLRLLTGNFQYLKGICQVPAAQGEVSTVGIPGVSSDTPPVASSLRGWLEQLFGGPSHGITATGTQRSETTFNSLTAMGTDMHPTF